MSSVPSRLSDVPSYVLYVLLNPAFNPRVALLLYAVIAVLILIVLVIGIMVLMGSGRDEEVARGDDIAHNDEFARLAVGEAFEGRDDDAAPAPRDSATPRPTSARSRVVASAAVALVVLAAWVTAGYTTSDPELCKNCHWPTSSHAKAVARTDPHAKVSCVSCHESGGLLERYVTRVPARLMHFANSRVEIAEKKEYGRVTSAACSSCHGSALQGVAVNATRGLKISHKEPLAASATCIDCHALRAGVVGAHNVGMAACLRCHDAKLASAKCATCHDDQTATAARARSASFAREQIPEVSCSGCHDEKRECDSCHGMRMPHSSEFKSYAHARAAAVDFWYNGGATCSRCHTATRHPCQLCHGKMLGKAHGTGVAWLAKAHQDANMKACDTCHQRFAYAATRDFCRDVCHTPAAVASSPR